MQNFEKAYSSKTLLVVVCFDKFITGVPLKKAYLFKHAFSIYFRDDQEPLLGSSGDRMFETMAMEIERLLTKVFMFLRQCWLLQSAFYSVGSIGRFCTRKSTP